MGGPMTRLGKPRGNHLEDIRRIVETYLNIVTSWTRMETRPGWRQSLTNLATWHCFLFWWNVRRMITRDAFKFIAISLSCTSNHGHNSPVRCRSLDCFSPECDWETEPGLHSASFFLPFLGNLGGVIYVPLMLVVWACKQHDPLLVILGYPGVMPIRFAWCNPTAHHQPSCAYKYLPHFWVFTSSVYLRYIQR